MVSGLSAGTRIPCVCHTVEGSVKKGYDIPEISCVLKSQEDQQVGDTFQPIHNICQQVAGIIGSVVKDVLTVTTTNRSLTVSP